jgi:hypothetical protein
VRYPAATRGVPRQWFDTEATAARATEEWQAAYRERIAAAEALLAEMSPSQLAKQRHRIARLKRALTLGPDGLRAAAAKAKASRKLARLQAG